MPAGDQLARILSGFTDEEQDAVLAHIDGGTSTEWIAETLTGLGYTVSPTTVKAFRKRRKGAL